VNTIAVIVNARWFGGASENSACFQGRHFRGDSRKSDPKALMSSMLREEACGQGSGRMPLLAFPPIAPGASRQLNRKLMSIKIPIDTLCLGRSY
jgi:hypothetical protein